MKNVFTILILFLIIACFLVPDQSLASTKALEQRYKRGVFFLDSHRYDEAIKAFTHVLNINPDFAKAYTARGLAWYKKGVFGRAITDFNKALDIDPLDAKAYNNRGLVWYKKGDYDRAIADYNKALDIDPNDAKAFNNRGLAWYKKGDYDRAIADYNKAQDIAASLSMKEKKDSSVQPVKMSQPKKPKEQKDSTIKSVEVPRAEQPKEKKDSTAKSVEISQPEKTKKEKDSTVKPVETSQPEKPKDQVSSSEVSKNQYTSYKNAFTVQVGAFLSSQNAENLTALLKKKGYAARLSKMSDFKGRIWHTVHIGDYATRKKAHKEAANFYGKEKMPSVIRHVEMSQPNKPKYKVSSSEISIAQHVSSKKAFTVQVGAFLSSQNAENLTSLLKKKGYAARLSTMSDNKGGAWHTVRIGGYATRKQAQKEAKSFSAKEKMASIVRPIDSL